MQGKITLFIATSANWIVFSHELLEAVEAYMSIFVGVLP